MPPGHGCGGRAVERRINSCLSKGRSRKFSGAGFMLGGRCGSLAVGASPVDAYTDGGRGDGP